jgi:hypothetical protein
MVVNPDGEIVHTSQMPNARVQNTQIPNYLSKNFEDNWSEESV